MNLALPLFPPAPRAMGLLFALALLLALVPLAVVAWPPLHDYPFHLARAEAVAALMGQVGHGTVYRIGSFALPNEAMDVVTLALTAVMPVEVAGRVFLGLVQALLLGGTVALHWALHRRLSPWPLLAAFFLYNWIFLYGFTNYLFGVAMMLWGLAAWVALADGRWWLRALAGTAMGMVVLFCHLVAFGLYAAVLGGWGLHAALARRRMTPARALGVLVLHGVPALAGLALFVALSPTASEVRQPIGYHPWWGWKLLMAWRPLLGSNPMLDLATIGPVAVLAAGLAVTRRLVLAPAMLLPLLLLAGVYAVMPYTLFGSLYGDARLPVAILLVAIASLSVRRLPRRALVLGGVACALLLVGRIAGVTRDWIATQTVFERHVTAFQAMPEGSVLWATTAGPYPMLAYRDGADLELWRPPLKHVASLAAVGRDIFVPMTWADPFKQPIVLPPEREPAKLVQGDNPVRTETAPELERMVEAIRRLDKAGPNYLLLSYPERLRGELPAGLAEVTRAAEFVLLKVE